MRKIVFIFTILIFQQNLYSQKDIVGKVEYYKSKATEWVLFRDYNDDYTKNINNRKSKIQVIQGDSIIEYETDSTGVFVIKSTLKDSIKIIVNDYSPAFDERFKFNLNDIKDTLKLRISDKKLAIKIDSTHEPEFYSKYSETQAEIDFRNGKREILVVGYDWPTDETTENRKHIAETYNVNYNYFFDSSQSEQRIMFRYNQIMRKLIGIKENVW